MVVTARVNTVDDVPVVLRGGGKEMICDFVEFFILQITNGR